MTAGIHHITAIAADGAQTVAFYSELLGLRLVKTTVNQDDVQTYHLFFGDKEGNPGLDLTFFIFKPATAGKTGRGMVSLISLAVPAASLDFWRSRLQSAGLSLAESTRFGEPRLQFFDPDGLPLELVGVASKDLKDSSQVWETEQVSKDQAIRHFHSATLTVDKRTSTQMVLEQVFDYKHIQSEANVHLYTVPHSQRASFLELRVDRESEWGIPGAGTVHHLAFRASDQGEQSSLRGRAIHLGLQPTPMIDRFYFQSVYFRIPAGVLLEIATDGPGFTADESVSELGQRLALPPFLEPQRRLIEAGLPPLHQAKVE